MIKNLRALATYVQVVDAGSLSAASRVLGLTLPTVSRDVAHLEEELGAILLQRTTRRLSVTDEGRAFYVRARRVLDELAAATEEARPPDAVVRGTVRLVLPTVTLPYGFSAAVAALMESQPQLRLQIALDDQPIDLVAGGWDVAVSFGSPADATHIAKKLASVRPLMAAAPAYLERRGVPGHPSELVEHECLRFIGDRPQASWLLRGPDGQTSAWPVSGRLEIDNSAGLAGAMHAGLGIGVTSTSGLAAGAKTGALARVLPDWTWAEVPVYALLPAGRNRIPRVRVVLDWLEAWVSHAFA